MLIAYSIVVLTLLVILKHVSGGLIHQNCQVDDVALSTMAANAALAIDPDFASLTASFLVKRVRYNLLIENITADEGPFSVALVAGNASAAEAGDGFNSRNTAGPDDVTQTLTQDQPWVVMQDSKAMFTPITSTFHSLQTPWMSLGNGIPAVEGAGWQLFLHNGDNAALTTGAVIKGTYDIQGVWLGA